MDFYGSQTGYTGYTFGGVDGERMRIDSSGNVGIGNTIPGAYGARLAVGDPSNTSNNALLFLTQYATFSIAANGVSSAAGTTFDYSWATGGQGPLIFSASNVEAMRITGSRDVGIGTSSPGAKLHVATPASGAGVIFRYASGTNNPGLFISTIEATSVCEINASGSTGNNNLAIAISNTERARIDSSGNLLVGTTSSTSAAGRIESVVTGSTAAGFTNDSFASAPTVTVWNKDGTSGRLMNFRSTGSFTSVGTIETNGTTTTYGTSSDARLKDNIADADDTADLIDALQVRQFDWKSNGSHQRYGFVAQELLEIAPEAVQVPANPEETMGVDYSKLVPMLIKEVQSLRARVAQLEGN
jgi:hypothetical protein